MRNEIPESWDEEIEEEKHEPTDILGEDSADDLEMADNDLDWVDQPNLNNLYNVLLKKSTDKSLRKMISSCGMPDGLEL